MARDPGGLTATVAVAASAMARRAATADEAHGPSSKGQTAADLQQVTNRRTRVPQGNPGARAGSRRARRGSQGGAQPAPPGPGGTGPGLPMRHPRTRRTSGPSNTMGAGDGRRVQMSGEQRDVMNGDCIAAGRAASSTVRRRTQAHTLVPERSRGPGFNSAAGFPLSLRSRE